MFSLSILDGCRRTQLGRRGDLGIATGHRDFRGPRRLKRTVAGCELIASQTHRPGAFAEVEGNFESVVDAIGDRAPRRSQMRPSPGGKLLNVSWVQYHQPSAVSAELGSVHPSDTTIPEHHGMGAVAFHPILAELKIFGQVQSQPGARAEALVSKQSQARHPTEFEGVRLVIADGVFRAEDVLEALSSKQIDFLSRRWPVQTAPTGVFSHVQPQVERASVKRDAVFGVVEDVPSNGVVWMTSLTVDEATALVCAVAHSREDEVLNLNGLKSIEPEVAHELAKFEGTYLTLDGLTSIDKAVAQELVRFRGGWLGLDGLTSIEEESLECLKSNPSIRLPETYQDEKKAD